MLSFLIAILAGSSAVADSQPSSLPGLFEAACLDGQAKLGAGDVTQISFDQLPAKLQKQLGRPASGKIWQLNSGGHSYLYLLSYNDARGTSPKICGLASDAMDLKAAGDSLEMRMTGSVSPNRTRSAQWLNTRDGYVATATTADAFKVLQISWMSTVDREATQAQAQALAN
jgi:hypothetical protein